MLVYVSWRAASVPLLDRHVSRKCFVGAGFVLWVVFYLARAWAHHGSGPLAKALEFVGMTCLGVMFLCSIALLAVDLGTGFGRLLPSWAPTLRGWALVAGGLLSSLALVQGLRAPAVVSYEVGLPSLPAALDGKLLVAMSDTHLGALVGERWMAARIAEAQALNPDLVVFLGDMFEGHGDAPVDLPALRPSLGSTGQVVRDGQPRVSSRLRRRHRRAREGRIPSPRRRMGRGRTRSDRRRRERPHGARSTRSRRRPDRACPGRSSARCHGALVSHPAASRDGRARRRRVDDLRTHPRRADLAVRPPGSNGPSAARRPVQRQRDAGHRVSRYGDLGTSHATLAPW